jgi:hypothetical protein
MAADMAALGGAEALPASLLGGGEGPEFCSIGFAAFPIACKVLFGRNLDEPHASAPQSAASLTALQLQINQAKGVKPRTSNGSEATLPRKLQPAAAKADEANPHQRFIRGKRVVLLGTGKSQWSVDLLPSACHCFLAQVSHH